MQESEVDMENNSLASDILKVLNREARRRFIIIIVLIVALLASNIAWLIAWNLPATQEESSYELQGEDSANVIYSSGEGDVKINGQD